MLARVKAVLVSDCEVEMTGRDSQVLTVWPTAISSRVPTSSNVLVEQKALLAIRMRLDGQVNLSHVKQERLTYGFLQRWKQSNSSDHKSQDLMMSDISTFHVDSLNIRFLI